MEKVKHRFPPPNKQQFPSPSNTWKKTKKKKNKKKKKKGLIKENMQTRIVYIV